MRIAIITCLAAISLLCIPGRAAAEDRLPKDFPYDPVAFVAGQEVAGKDDLTIVRDRFRYKFFDANNKAAFEKEPERYEVQLGGACARMGPLNAGGQTELAAVLDGRIYLFATQSCRRTFLDHPDALLETDDAPPETTDDSSRRGRELLEQMVKWMGGADKVDAVKTYDDKMLLVAGNDTSWNGTFIQFPGSFCEKSRRNDTWWSTTAAGDVGWFDSIEQTDPMARSQHHAFVRQMSRMPLVIVRSRTLPNFVCSWIGPSELNGTAVEQVAVAINGATTTLLIDPRTGQLHGTTYRGRGPQEFMGTVEVALTDPQIFDGVTLPLTRTVNFNGEYAAEMSGTIDEVHINPAIDEQMFEMPKGK